MSQWERCPYYKASRETQHRSFCRSNRILIFAGWQIRAPKLLRSHFAWRVCSDQTITMASKEWHFHDPTETCKYEVTQSSHNAGETVTVHSGRNTDWWSTAVGSVPESDAHRDSGPVAYKTLSSSAATGWKLSGWISQEGRERFQQTTLFVKLGKDKWLKSGIENENEMQYVG